MSGLQKFLLGATSGGGGGTVTAGANVGAGTGEVFRNITGTTMNFRRLLAGAGMTITTVGDDVIVTNTAGGSSQAHIERFVAGAGQTLFTVANVPASAQFVWVSNGSGQYEKQNALDDYTVAGSNITFNVGRVLNEVITIQYVSSIPAPATQTSIQFQDEGVNLGATGTVDTVDFVGAGVTATRIGNTVTATIPGGSGVDNQYVQATQTGAQLINGVGPSIGPFKMNFDTAIGVVANFDNVNDRIVVPVGGAGTYEINYNAFVKINGSNATLFTINVYKNGLLQNFKTILNLTGVASFLDYTIGQTCALDLVAGDFIELFVTASAPTTYFLNIQGSGGLVSLAFKRLR